MRFAVALPWWGYLLAFGAAGALAWLAYARVRVALTSRQRALLTSLRGLTLILLVIFLFRPVVLVPASSPRDGVVPILVDVSRSMRIADAGGPRIVRAAEIARDLERHLSPDFRTELVTFGERLARGEIDRLAADARRSDLSGAVAALADRYRGDRLAGIIVLSDGGDTAGYEVGSGQRLDVPVFTIGIGEPRPARDREVINVTAGEPVLTGSSIDLSVSAVSYGYGTQPIELRLTENGRPIEVRRVTPTGDGAPIHALFTVSPSPSAPTVYAVEVPADPGELVAENNVRRVLVPPQGRTRRVLVVEGAPGFEHSFLKRALSRDPGLEVDSVVRKGQNEEGRDTFFVQAASSRAAALATGYPRQRTELFEYDAVIFGNIEGDFFTRDQLAMTAAFVAERGGGLLVLGARSFEGAALTRTPLEEVLPLDLTNRRTTIARAAAELEVPAASAVQLTPDGATHPATRLAASIEDSRTRWSHLPPLAAVTAVGAPRAGAQVLAVTLGAGGDLRPLIAAQRYGLGRAVVFAGEASWRWRMMLPATDTTFELVWRQLTRWIASGAVEPIEIPPAAVALPGTTEPLSVVVRDREFRPLGDAEVTFRVQDPAGQERTLSAVLAEPREGRYSAAVRFEEPGVYAIAADVRRESQTLGTASRLLLVGGADLEMSEPRLNEAVLRRMADTSKGQYVASADAHRVPALIRAAGETTPPTEMRDLWHNGWSLAAIVLLLAAEWVARRRVGLA